MKQRHMEGEDHPLRFSPHSPISSGIFFKQLSLQNDNSGVHNNSIIKISSLEEILDETNQLDVSGKTRQWLQQEALNHNPKIEVSFLSQSKN